MASLVALAAALGLTSGLGERSGQPICFVVPTAAGGGFDTTPR